MILLLLTFLLAHFLGDFVLQPHAWVVDKQEKGIRSMYLYVHIGIHFALMAVLTRFQIKYLSVLIFLALIHGCIDLLKIYAQRQATTQRWFFIDQILHLISLFLAVQWIEKSHWLPFLEASITPKKIVFFTFFIAATFVTAVVQKVVLTPWKRLIKSPVDSPSNNAGWYIGLLERSFVFLFVVLHFWSGIGFLLAAKSIFRIGDLTRPKDVAVTEYILIGTLISFGSAVFFGLLYHYFLPLIAS